ncbi:MAG: type IV secretion system DNA-binding domain-containing protein, partial [Microcystis panniformis]
MLAARGDLYAPSAGLPFKLSLKDLTQHLLVLGGIGSGKTAGILRPIARQAGQAEGVGLVVLDGKGALPGELKDVVKGMQIVDPRNSRVSLVKGLQPATLVDTIIDVIGARKNSADQFFTDSAADLLRKAAILAQAAGGDYWTLSSIGKIATNSDSQNDVILAIPESAETLTVGEAAEFFMEDWENTEERVKSNIIATARSWLNTISSHPDLAAWADTN